MAQLHHCLSDGPGVFVITNLISDHTTIDRANSALEEIIRREKENAGGGKGDHFAPGGANDRIWNSFQKHAMVDPESFIEYYANDLLYVTPLQAIFLDCPARVLLEMARGETYRGLCITIWEVCVWI